MLKKLLVCVCFHYSAEKFPHLCQVVENFILNYTESDIIIDTNNHHSEKEISKKFGMNSRIKTVVHDRLLDPFHLAWAHRKHFKREMDYYDVFMYVEDDILVPYENYLNYLDVFKIVWPNYIPSFVRTEEKDGQLYCADALIRTRVREADILVFKGRRFITLDNPYHAFWVMPRDALKESMNCDFEKIYEGNKWIREIAASYGLMPGKRPCVRWGSYDIQKIGLVEVDRDMKISNLCFVKHTTNKYINDCEFNFGKIQIERIIKKDAMFI